MSSVPVKNALSRAWPLVVVLPLVLVLAACGTELKQADPQKQFFMLEAQRPGDAGAVVLEDSVLNVRQVNVAPSFSSREMIYRLQESEYVADYYNLFLVTPSDVFSQRVRQWLDAAGVFTHVAAPNSDLRPDFILESSVKALYGDFRNKNAPIAVMEVQFFLLRDTGTDYEVGMTKTYSIETPVQPGGAAPLVAGWNKALVEVLTMLEQDIRASLR